MYVFYGDESGFSKGGKLEKQQPITVFAGVLIDLTKLSKALRVFDDTLAYVNNNLADDDKIAELKFSAIRQGKYPYSVNFHEVDDKADLLQKIVADFQQEISFRIFYSAIQDKAFFRLKKENAPHIDRLKHPYLAACYRVVSQIQHAQKGKAKNKGKTFFILDEQNIFQTNIEDLVTHPIHIKVFTEVIDTAYFGKSHYSKLIQIADLIAGIIRLHLTNVYLGKPARRFDNRIENVFKLIASETVFRECFRGELKTLYDNIEIKPKN